MKRTFMQRLRVFMVFVRSEHYDKPGTRDLCSLSWWINAWRDAAVLGA